MMEGSPHSGNLSSKGTRPAVVHRRPRKAAKREGASGEQIMEAIWVASEMRAGAAWAHALKAVDLIDNACQRGS